MPVTVRSVLELEIFRRAGARILVGGGGLDRQVRWVHMGEVPDIASFLVGGELLLTAGLGMGCSPEEQRRYVASIANAGIAVLIIEAAGRAFDCVPQPIVEAGRISGLPIVELRREIRFVEVTAQVHNRLLDDRYAALTAAEAVGRQLTELLLNGGDVVDVVGCLAEVVDRVVVLEDAAHQVVVHAPVESAYPSIDPWDRHSRHGHHLTGRGSEEQSQTLCCWQPIVLQGETWGWLHVLDPDEAAAELTATALERAASAVSIALLADYAHGERRQLRNHGLLTQLRSGELTGLQFIARARALGCDLPEQSLMILEITGTTVESASQLQWQLEGWQPRPFVTSEGGRGERLVCVTGIPANTCPDELLTRVSVEEVRAAGASRVVSASGLRLALDQARQAHMVAMGRGEGTRCSYEQLGIGRLLAALGHTPELTTFVEDELGALLEHDAYTSHPLLPTLRAYLDCAGNKVATADRLHIQRRSLYNRLARLVELVGPLDEAEERARLLLAVRALEMLGCVR